MPAPSKVAIVGAGPQGLAALKNLLELNAHASEPLFTPTLFDSRSSVGGVWSFNADKDTLSVLKSTLGNVSRWLNCYSDFPVAEAWAMDGRDGDPPTHLNQAEQQMVFDKYVEKFGLHRYIKLSTEVKKIARSAAEGGKWEVETLEVESGVKRSEVFDKIIIATGQVNTPYTPEISGIERFGGKTLHSCAFKRYSTFPLDVNQCKLSVQ
jgi:dimethylaniline monooxygenase (N-oxide forming)